MDTVTLVLLLLLIVVLAVAAWFFLRQRKQAQLRGKFGPEYDRAVQGSGKRREAERDLKEREQRRAQLDIRPLDPDARDEFAAQWRGCQERFVDAPVQAVKEADLLVERVMHQRGYPVGDFDQMARDVSVDHATVVEEYRKAHEISQLNDRNAATTEQLRQAMVHYRSLFADLLDAGEYDRGKRRRPDAPEQTDAPVRPPETPVRSEPRQDPEPPRGGSERQRPEPT